MYIYIKKDQQYEQEKQHNLNQMVRKNLAWIPRYAIKQRPLNGTMIGADRYLIFIPVR